MDKLVIVKLRAAAAWIQIPAWAIHALILSSDNQCAYDLRQENMTTDINGLKSEDPYHQEKSDGNLQSQTGHFE